MKIIETVSGLEKIQKGSVLTIGNFDGVHLGHQKVLNAAKQIAAERKTELVVITFEPHPLAILYPDISLRILTPWMLKKHLLAGFGVDYLVALKSSSELLSLSPADFVEQFLVKNIQPKVVVEGESFNFGYGRTGSIHTLRNLGAEKGFSVFVIDSRAIKLSIGQSIKISSTMIRSMLESGKAADAAIALSRPYRLMELTYPGRGKGKQLGFPTLNLKIPKQVIPAEGVYAGFVETGDSLEQICEIKEKIPAAFSIGRTKTYGSDKPLSIEAHLIESAGDLTGKWMAMDFIKRIRSQQKFKTEAELSGQIARDCEKAKEILAANKH